MADGITIPHELKEALLRKTAILFLGAGASKEAKNDRGERAPNADNLRDHLSKRFFGKILADRDVMAVAEMAIATKGGSSVVFDEVAKAFDGFKTSDAHRLASQFNWRLIATTNYDTFVEDAYRETKDKFQTLVRFVKDSEPVEQKMQEVTNPVQFVKLHGCLDHRFDSDIPLVLSRAQYATYSRNRERLFNRLKYFAPESVVIFVGYRLEDAHVREMIYSLALKDRPRWFMVNPEAEDYDVDFWGTKNVGVFRCRFGTFMSALNAVIPRSQRLLQRSELTASFPVRRYFVTNNEESERLRESFAIDLDFVHAGLSYSPSTPKQFYEGYDLGWTGIISRYDVRRKIVDDLIYRAFLELEDPKEPKLFVVKGAAGAGKTIALRRAAYEAATSSAALVLWLKVGGALKPEVFIELYKLTAKTIYLFVDEVALHTDVLLELLKAARSKGIPLVVISAERDADWNTYAQSLDNAFPPTVLKVGNLSDFEMEGLLELLDRHNCLGLLKDKSPDEQLSAFKEKADRQLLVALHELTQGRPFEEIVYMEHMRVPEKARQVYLDVATMHQFGVPLRAGPLRRITGIEFEDFKFEFFEPLENIVQTAKDVYSGDDCYKTRHATVARLVFQQACPNDEAKSRQLARLIDGLDVAYASDTRAFDEITRGRTLAETFANVQAVREIYAAAVAAAPEHAYVLQQWAIFESTHPRGSLVDAERLATKAASLDPESGSIIHTRAEVDRKLANVATSDALRASLRKRSRVRLGEMRSSNRFGASTRCKLLVDEVADLTKELSDDAKPSESLRFSEKVRDAEVALQRAQEAYPDDADIIQVEARLRQTLNDEERALKALNRAWRAKPRGSSTASRIAQIYQTRRQGNLALDVLSEAIARNPDDRTIHQAIARFYLGQDEFEEKTVEDHLRQSFSIGDNNFDARFMLAEFLFLKGDIGGASDLFFQINRDAPASFRRVASRQEDLISARIPRTTGVVDKIKEGFLFVKAGIYPRKIFCHFSEIRDEELSALAEGDTVQFSVHFNREGPVATKVARTAT